jgi:hypothetical protein
MRIRLALALGDLAAVVAFAVLGLTSHDEGVGAAGLARTALPLAGAWLLAALAFGAYRRPGLRTLVPAWAVGVTAGVAIRAAVVGRFDGGTLAFLGVALGVTLALLLAWRGLAAVVVRRAAAR